MMSLPQILSGLVFLICLFLIFSEKLNRTITAMVGAVTMVGLGMLLHFYSQDQAVEAIDFNTVGLLLGMMALVALLEPTGLFQYLAVWAGRLSRGSPKRLLILLGVVTTVLSMFLDNVATVVVVAPVAILIPRCGPRRRQLPAAARRPRRRGRAFRRARRRTHRPTGSQQH